MIHIKTIGIINDTNSQLSEFLRQNLMIVFEDVVHINNYYLDQFQEGDLVHDDIVLVMSRERAVQAKPHISNSESIIVIHRTIREQDTYKIFAIPKNTKVLVVNDTTETTLETISLLYQIGVNHLNLTLYEESKDFGDIKVAITPGVASKVPGCIQKIIDIGNRCIDVSTFIQIINKLKIDNKEIRRRLIKYLDTIVTLDGGIKNHYKELYVKNEELDMVVNLSNQGILLADNENTILLCNRAFRIIFNIKDDITGGRLDNAFDSSLMETFLKENLVDELVEFSNKYMIINKHRVDYAGEKSGYYLNVQEVTYIKQLEQNLSKKLRDKGFIARYSFDSIRTDSERMRECIGLAKKIADSELTVFITGESGTGKELMAQSIHNFSKRCKQPFVAVNCAAVTETLLESELFGYEGGAFTGALKEGKAGLFEMANNGTIFLDEIGDMPLALQTRLLRVLQERQVMRIGSQRVIGVNVRVIAATNKNLNDMVKKGLFREDLYYRVNVLPINIPPLRKRREDILLLLQHFIGGAKRLVLSEDVKVLLTGYEWPGNIRELQNVASYIELMNEEKVTMDKLPYYLLQQQKSFDKELEIIEESFGLLKTMEVLKLIDQYNRLNLCIGRKNIEKLLSDHDVHVNESEIRRILQSLNDMGIVSSSVGRKGTEITDYGKELLKWAENR